LVGHGPGRAAVPRVAYVSFAVVVIAACPLRGTDEKFLLVRIHLEVHAQLVRRPALLRAPPAVRHELEWVEAVALPARALLPAIDASLLRTMRPTVVAVRSALDVVPYLRDRWHTILLAVCWEVRVYIVCTNRLEESQPLLWWCSYRSVVDIAACPGFAYHVGIHALVRTFFDRRRGLVY
jgi:hypothetical protein